MNPRADSGTKPILSVIPTAITPRTALTDITPTLDTARASTHDVTSQSSYIKSVKFLAL